MTLRDPMVARAAGAAALLGALVHVGALGNGFAYDDWVLIAGDPGIRSFDGLGARLLQPSWPGGFGDAVGGWRPVTTATWAVTWVATSGSVVAFHALGIVLHTVASALVVLLLALLVPTGAAAAGGLIFAVHPVHVEAVANVVGSAEPLAAIFALSAAIVYLKGGVHFGLLRGLAVAGLYALALLSKEGAAVLPAMLLLVDAARADRDALRSWEWIRPRLAVQGSMFAVLVGMLWARTAVVGGATVASHPPGASVLNEIPRIWTVVSAWPHYARLLLFPLELSADYGPGLIPVAYGLNAQGVVGTLLAVGALAACAWAWRHSTPLASPSASEEDRGRVAAVGVLWIGLAMLPVSNLLFLGPVLVAERTFYLASVGLALVAAVGFDALLDHRRRLAFGMVAAFVIFGSLRTITRIPDWESTDSIMEALFDDHPESGRGWFALGQRLMRDGRQAEARRAFSIALGLLNSEYKESTEVASHLLAMGRGESSRLLLERAWREVPEWPTAPGLLAAVELGAGRYDEAARAAGAAAENQPENASLHHLLAEAYSRGGRAAQAVPARREAIRRGMGSEVRAWLLLAADLASAGDTVSARSAVDSAAARATTEAHHQATEEARVALGSLPSSNELD